MNISHILEGILPNIMITHNSNYRTSTSCKRPDFSRLTRNRCILPGEEKGTRTSGDPAQEVIAKLEDGWKYDPLSYILGPLRFYYPLAKLVRMCHCILRRNHTSQLCGNS